MPLKKIKTDSITDDAITAAKIDDDGTGFTFGDLAVTGAVDFSSTASIKMPSGTTAQRGASTTGALRFNSQTPGFEGYDGTSWGVIGGGSTSELATSATLKLTGTYEETLTIADAYVLTGDVTLNGNFFTAKLTDDGNAITITDDGNNRTITGQGSFVPGAMYDDTFAIATPTQPNITSVGTLTGLTVSGDLTVGVIANLETAVVANTAKVTNATHTGDVTGGTALTIEDDAVTGGKLANDIAISTTGNIATTGSGTVTSAGIVSAPSLVLTPGSTPTATEGAMYYDSTDDVVKIYNGSEWIIIPVPQNVSGGTITTLSGYNVHTFIGNGTFVISGGNITADVLIVAGGGGTGWTKYHNGGGGGGGLVFGAGVVLTPGSYSIVVGAGGAGATAYQAASSNGGDSSGFGFTASGGGASGAYNTSDPQAGGSGGGGMGNGGYGTGASSNQNTYSGTSSWTGFGNSGGNGGQSMPNAYGGGAGGGAGGAGGSGNSTHGGVGGVGKDYSSYFGTGVGDSGWFAGGGGGNAMVGTPGAGGNGGGGAGGTGHAVAGTAGTGGGAGGGERVVEAAGKNGGSGIVIIRYLG